MSVNMKSFNLFVFYAFTFFSTGWALPAPLEKRDVSAALLSQLSYFEQYAAAAYCPENNQPGSSPAITCTAGNCPQVQSAGARSILEFQNKGPADATGFVSVSDANQQIVISFRGSRSLSNFIGNVNIAFAPFTSVCKDCFVHAGFLSSWLATKNDILAALQTAVKQYPSYAIVVTGHSLGGAIATLAAADLRQTGGYKLALYTYGSPMVGNDPFALFVTAQPGGNFRVTHASDVVPKLPGYLLGYRHVSPEYWITSGDNVPVTTRDIQVSSGTLNLNGNGATLDPSISNHLWYFNAIAACEGSDFSIKRRQDGGDGGDAETTVTEDVEVLKYVVSKA